MWSKFPLLVAFLLPISAGFAQDQSAPGSPQATPGPDLPPSTATTSEVSGATPATEATPEAEATPGTEATPTPAAGDAAPAASPSPSPTPEGDVIPIESSRPSAGGAPLETRDIAPAVDAAMPDEAFTDPNAIVPDVPPPAPVTRENVQEKARRISIRYKEVRVQAEKDPKVANMLSQSETAKTPEDRRAAQREYYRLLFRKITALDKSLEPKCKALEAAYLRRLAQERLEPTIPLNPPPTPEPLN